MQRGRKGLAGRRIDYREEIPYSNGTLSKVHRFEFDHVRSPGFQLAKDEEKAIEILTQSTRIDDSAKAEIFVSLLEEKEKDRVTRNRERQFCFPRGKICFFKAMNLMRRAILDSVPDYQIFRNTRIPADVRARVFGLQNGPDDVTAAEALENYSPIGLRTFVDELSSGDDFRYFIRGLSYVTWAAYWNLLLRLQIVSAKYTKSCWQTFVQYFIERQELPFGLANAENLRKAVDKVNRNPSPFEIVFHGLRDLITEFEVQSDYQKDVRAQSAKVTLDAMARAFLGTSRTRDHRFDETRMSGRPMYFPLIGGKAICSHCGSEGFGFTYRGAGVIAKRQAYWSNGTYKDPMCFDCFSVFVKLQHRLVDRYHKAQRWKDLN